MTDEFHRINGQYLLNAVEDAPDFRDFEYQPALIMLRAEVPRPDYLNIRDQGREGACTGFGLAAAIDLQLRLSGDLGRTASTRMLYETAKQFDEWEGEDYQGSSCRGAVKGWHGMGVCSEEVAPYESGEQDWVLTVDQAKDARKTTLGAYYRVNKRISDYHAAINEVGALYVSAMVHKGWQRGAVEDGVIDESDEILGGHAFAIVGYNSDGFWIQNSWGEDWGDGGAALWKYEDWLENGRDAWVLRLGVSTPQIWHLKAIKGRASLDEERAEGGPRRGEVIGHFVHIDDGRFDERGKYGTDLETVMKTATFLAGSDEFDHLLFYAHGGLNDINASARRVAAMKEVFKDNGIYPFHFMYDTGLLEEVKDIIFGHKQEVESRAAGIADFTDKLVERATRDVGRAIWREMKYGATSPFLGDGAGSQTIDAFLEAFAADGAKKKKKVHLAGHSTGAILLANLIGALGRREGPPRLRTVSLFAPACTHELFHESFKPALKSSGGFGIDRMTIYNLDPNLELDDTVTPIYRKSLLYLVSNAYEEETPERILGMQVFRNRLGPLPKSLRFEISDGPGANPKTESSTHGGFDNDVATMNDLLRSVLGGSPERPFEEEDLEY